MTAAARRIALIVNEASFFLSHRLPVGLAAREAGYQVVVVCPDSPDTHTIRSHGLDWMDATFDRGGQNPLRDIVTLGSLVRALRAVQPQLVHNVTIKPMIYGSLAARLCGVPAVVNAVSGLGYTFIGQGAVARLRRMGVVPLLRTAFAHPNAWCIVQNPDDLELLLRSRVVRADRTRMIRGSGVDLTLFSQMPETSEKDPVVLLAARLLGDKGVREFVEAARAVRRLDPSVRFVLAGATNSANPTAVSAGEVEGWVREGVVEWRGHSADMAGQLQGATIVVLPSYREGVPKVLLEAAAVGRAIITTDVPGNREVVRHGWNGFLVPPRDSDALARSILQLLGDAELRREMGERSRQRAECEFSQEHVVESTLRVYAEALSRAA